MPHSLINFEREQYYQNEPRFNGVCSRDNLQDKTKNRVYVINVDEYADSGTRWIALHALNNNFTYFDSFGVEHVPKQIKIFIDKSIVVANIFRIQAYDSVTRWYFCIGFIAFKLPDKTLTDFTNLFSINSYKKNDDILLKYFMANVWKWLNAIQKKHILYIQT